MFGQVTQLSELMVPSFFNEATWVFMGREDWGGNRKHFPARHIFTWWRDPSMCTKASAWPSGAYFHMQVCAVALRPVFHFTPLCTKQPPAGDTVMSTSKITMVPIQCQITCQSLDSAVQMLHWQAWSPFVAAAQTLFVLSGHTEETAGWYGMIHAIQMQLLCIPLKQRGLAQRTWPVLSRP